MALVEYLYVDEQRLDAYFEQISSPVTYDKVPMWNAQIGLTGPRAGGAQQRFARPFTRPEKISKLTEYLEDEGLVGYGRAGRYDDSFHLETCQAKRVFIPTKQRKRVFSPTKLSDSSSGGLSIWISVMDRSSEHGAGQEQRPRWTTQANLYLLEDYRGADTTPDLEIHPTSYTMLDLLLKGDLSWLTGDASRNDLPDLDLSGASDNRELRRFSADPTVALSQLGAQVGPARNIRSLYRIRARLSDTSREAIFGYPIFIAEGTDTV